MFRKIMKKIQQFSGSYSNSRRHKNYKRYSSSDRRGYRKSKSYSSSDHRKRNPYGGSHYYKRRKHSS
ncbi:hypothetical protein [Niallia circulans]|uniref:hypothetical protein n=2 Tax=Bacillaceae TaxID=186817 RepID=UPI003525380B